MKRYRKKPVEVVAIQLKDDIAVLTQIYEFLGLDSPTAAEHIHGRGNFPETGHGIDPADGEFKITTLEGVMIANIGDWIIKGVKGEFYPCKDEIFRLTYECIGEVKNENKS